MPLTGIRILDLTRLVPGAYCTMLLAEMGADVVKVEEPGAGDYMRWTPPLVDGQSALFEALNRGKKSVALDLKTDRGRDALLRLVDTADVLVEGNRPGVMERLGLGWALLHARNPRLVMCSITGYGQDGPFAARAGHDLNYMAIAGGLGLNGPSDGPPVPLSAQVADVGGGGMQAAVEILGALVAVQRGGNGRHLDVSMTDGAVTINAIWFAARAAGETVGRGNMRLTGRFACYRVYECKDGRYYSVAALEPKFWTNLCHAVGSPDLIEAQYSTSRETQRAMELIFATRTRDEWQQSLDGLDVCCEPVLEVDEVSSHPQVIARGLFERRRETRAPALGEHTDELLREIGL